LHTLQWNEDGDSAQECISDCSGTSGVHELDNYLDSEMPSEFDTYLKETPRGIKSDEHLNTIRKNFD